MQWSFEGFRMQRISKRLFLMKSVFWTATRYGAKSCGLRKGWQPIIPRWGRYCWNVACCRPTPRMFSRLWTCRCTIIWPWSTMYILRWWRNALMTLCKSDIKPPPPVAEPERYCRPLRVSAKPWKLRNLKFAIWDKYKILMFKCLTGKQRHKVWYLQRINPYFNND